MKRKELFHLNIEKAEQARKLLEADPHFQEVIFNVQSKLRIRADDPERETNLSKLPEVKVMTMDRKIIHSFREIRKDSHIYKEVIKILKQFKLPGDYWYRGVSHYILYNKFSHGSSMGLSEAETEPDIIEGKDPMTGLPTFSIKIGRNTTLDDIKFLWPMVAIVRTGEYDVVLPKTRFSQRRNYERDCYIYKLYIAAEKKLTTEVLGFIWNRVKAKYNQDLEYQTIKTVVTRMKKELAKKPLEEITS